MQTVEALTGFDHGGKRCRGDQFKVSDNVAQQLSRARLVRVIEARPQKVAGAKSSASPAAQASPQTTAKRSKRGGRKSQAAESS